MKIIKKCKDCGKEIKRYDAERCNHCAKVGELSPVYKGYDKLFTKKQLEKEYETQSIVMIARKYKIPNTCMYRIFAKFEIKRRKSNDGGIFSPGFKHGKCSLPKFCSICNSRLSNNPNATICRPCTNRLMAKDPIVQERKSQIAINGWKKDNWAKKLHAKKLKYKGIWMRSGWEIKYAKYLDKNNVKWLYESKTFDLGSTTYTPDFYLPKINKYIEIKGYFRNNSKLKFNLFKKIYFKEKISLLQKEDLKQMGVL